MLLKDGLYANIHRIRAPIKTGSGERMKRAGEEGRPSAQDFKESAKTAKKPRRQHIAEAMAKKGM